MIDGTIWDGCYNSNHKELVTPDSFTHPAKMAVGLCERIFDYGQERGYWKPGDLIADPFGGIFTTGIIGAYRGYRVVGVELEKRFADLARANIEKNRRKLEMLGRPLPVILQGDSRELGRLIGQASGAITSPPFLAQSGGTNVTATSGPLASASLLKRHSAGNAAAHGYGESDGNVGNLPEGDYAQVVGAITSPPYADGCAHNGGDDQPGKLQGGTYYGVGLTGAITSPPYAESLGDGKSGIDWGKQKDRETSHSHGWNGETYGATPGQLGAMKEGDFQGVITSPPWENTEGANAAGKHADPEAVAEQRSKDYASGKLKGHFASKEAILKSLKKGNEQVYGDTPGNLGNDSGETYWQAVAAIYAEVFALLVPGGVMACVVKDFVRNKERVPLCDRTAELLQAIGFTITDRVYASLVKEQSLGVDLFSGEQVTKRTERKSFFRRLAEKNGSPRIDYEEVIFAQKPGVAP